MVFGWLVCVNWLLGERETFICKVQPTMKCREKQSLSFTLYLSEEPQCTNIIIFMPSLAGISNLHSCCCLLAFSFYKHFLAFIPFLPDHGPLTMLNCTHHPHRCAAQSGRTSADPKRKAWCFVCGVCPCPCECWELQLFNRMVLKLLKYLGQKIFVGYQLAWTTKLWSEIVLQYNSTEQVLWPYKPEFCDLTVMFIPQDNVVGFNESSSQFCGNRYFKY